MDLVRSRVACVRRRRKCGYILTADQSLHVRNNREPNASEIPRVARERTESPRIKLRPVRPRSDLVYTTCAPDGALRRRGQNSGPDWHHHRQPQHGLAPIRARAGALRKELAGELNCRATR
eukprot:2045721-Pyramimonas_sp.AAC.2